MQSETKFIFRCNECYNKDSNQRNFNEIKINVAQIKSFNNNENNISITCKYSLSLYELLSKKNTRKIKFQGIDGHISKYNVDWIKIQHQPESRLNLVLWSGRNIENEVPIVSDEENPEEVARILTISLLRYGIGFVKNVRKLPNWEKILKKLIITILQQVSATMKATENTVNKLGPVMHTIYGGMWHLNNTEGFEKYQDTAYSTQGLSVHTDNTYFIEPAG